MRWRNGPVALPFAGDFDLLALRNMNQVFQEVERDLLTTCYPHCQPAFLAGVAQGGCAGLAAGSLAGPVSAGVVSAHSSSKKVGFAVAI